MSDVGIVIFVVASVGKRREGRRGFSERLSRSTPNPSGEEAIGVGIGIARAPDSIQDRLRRSLNQSLTSEWISAKDGVVRPNERRRGCEGGGVHLCVFRPLPFSLSRF